MSDFQYMVRGSMPLLTLALVRAVQFYRRCPDGCKPRRR